MAIASVRECFRPLAGIEVSERSITFLKNGEMMSFRPLTGIKVSEQCQLEPILKIRHLFPSPLGD